MSKNKHMENHEAMLIPSQGVFKQRVSIQYSGKVENNKTHQEDITVIICMHQKESFRISEAKT